MKIYGLILAAGASQRMGVSKALLTLPDGSTLLSAQYELLKSARCDPIAIVVGADRKEIIKSHEALNAIWVENEGWEKGQFSSIQIGLNKLSASDPDTVMILPIDTVGVNLKTLKALIFEAHSGQAFEAFIPEYMGRCGHPVLITKKLIARILTTKSEDEAARLDLILSNSYSKRISVDDLNIRNNINSRSRWRNYISQLRSSFLF